MRKDEIDNLSVTARHAARAGDWEAVRKLARQILLLDRGNPEGWFLEGQAARATAEPRVAEGSFIEALRVDPARYDAAVELAELYVRSQRNTEAVALLRANAPRLANSPVYLEKAASAFARLDLHEEALPLYRRACELQPEIERFRTGLATCSANLGRLDAAIRIYEALLERHPDHQRFHYELAQLRTARDFGHVARMKAVLEAGSLPPSRNIFLYYALGKELEDLECWDEAFAWYEKAGQAAKAAAGYRVDADIRLIDALLDTCSESWLRQTKPASLRPASTPVFIVGLPRSGTTLLERMLASHSRVGTVGETFFFQAALVRESGSAGGVRPDPAGIPKVAASDMNRLAARYLEAMSYKIGREPYFIEKFPENFLYLGFVAKAFPEARIVHVRRHPMDVCFAMYKQSYFRFAYDLGDLGRFYVAYEKLMRHWRSLLGEQIAELQYEDLVGNPEAGITKVLDHLGLPFEAACLAPEENPASSRTASKVQVREPIHARSVGRWRHFERQLSSLREYLLAEGIAT